MGPHGILDGKSWSYATSSKLVFHGQQVFGWMNPTLVLEKDIDSTCSLMFPDEEYHWYTYSELHRDDGPAVTVGDEHSWYWHNLPVLKHEYMQNTKWQPNEYCNGLELVEMILEHG